MLRNFSDGEASSCGDVGSEMRVDTKFFQIQSRVTTEMRISVTDRVFLHVFLTRHLVTLNLMQIRSCRNATHSSESCLMTHLEIAVQVPNGLEDRGKSLLPY